MTNTTARLAEFAADLTYEQLPSETVHAVKRMLLDCLGTTLAGSSLGARLGLALDKGVYTETRPQTSQMLGYFNAAASAGRVLRLSPAQMHSALGLALMRCAGGRQPVVEGVEAKALYAAWPTQTGVQSA